MRASIAYEYPTVTGRTRRGSDNRDGCGVGRCRRNRDSVCPVPWCKLDTMPARANTGHVDLTGPAIDTDTVEHHDTQANVRRCGGTPANDDVAPARQQSD